LAIPCLLVGDIGGTNARFALADADAPRFSAELTLRCAEFETAELAITEYLDRSGAGQPDVICLAVAGPIVDDTVRFTNNDWSIDCRDLRTTFPSVRVQLLNDFEAIACSIPFLGQDDLAPIGLDSGTLAGRTEFTVGVLGSGTGLGVSGLLGRQGNFHPIVCEGGHAGFAPENRAQLRVLQQLREKFERVSNERLLSGPGLENIYQALCRIHDERGVPLEAPEIFRRAMANEDAQASEALQLFYEALGQVAGDLALVLGAWDGIYIGGGIVRRYPDLLKASGFRSGFENKGRYRSLMERIPTRLILHPQPGLLGAGYRARRM
jgi:glucokinase